MKMMVLIAVIGLSVSAGAQAQASFRDQAEVIDAQPVYRQVAGNYCQQPVASAERNTFGMVLGGVIGAVVGNQIGGGSGRDIATAAGAAIGGAIGGDYPSESRPHAVNNCGYMEERIVGYRGRVLYNGREFPINSHRPLRVGEMINIRVNIAAD
jgi:uncharacterized protein YcfJ